MGQRRSLEKYFEQNENAAYKLLARLTNNLKKQLQI